VTPDVLVREVGLRDGLQIIGTFVPTPDKQEWIDRCVTAGLREIEICSFVPEKYIPQFRDADEVAAHAVSEPQLMAAALVPNLRGAQRALAAGVGKLLCIISATEGFNQANLRRTKSQSLEELKSIVHLRDQHAVGHYRAIIQVGVSVAFGCPFEGIVADRDVRDTAVSAAEAGADEISLADTAGQGDPTRVRRIFRALAQELGKVPLAAHFHDTRGTGVANVLAALDSDVRAFDSSIAGLGGCPNSPGATGNIATEDLTFMLEAMGLDTGVDLGRLLEMRSFVARCLPDVRLFGHIAQVGLPKGFVRAVDALGAGNAAGVLR
jgi:hydroxymethylglutaryl-CoA lyase